MYYVEYGWSLITSMTLFSPFLINLFEQIKLEPEDVNVNLRESFIPRYKRNAGNEEEKKIVKSVRNVFHASNKSNAIKSYDMKWLYMHKDSL